MALRASGAGGRFLAEEALDGRELGRDPGRDAGRDLSLVCGWLLLRLRSGSRRSPSRSSCPDKALYFIWRWRCLSSADMFASDLTGRRACGSALATGSTLLCVGGADAALCDTLDSGRRCANCALPIELREGAVDTVVPLRPLAIGPDNTCTVLESFLALSDAYPCCSRFLALSSRFSSAGSFLGGDGLGARFLMLLGSTGLALAKPSLFFHFFVRLAL